MFKIQPRMWAARRHLKDCNKFDNGLDLAPFKKSGLNLLLLIPQAKEHRIYFSFGFWFLYS